MRKVITILISIHFLAHAALSQTGSVGIGTTTPHSSAALDVQSTEKGMLVPRMTTAQRTSISNAATGLLVFDNTSGTFWFYNGSAWTELVGGGGAGQWTQSGNNIYNSNMGNVGIGTTTPQYHLDINKPNATIGFTDSELNQFSGLITGNGRTLTVNSVRSLLGDGTTPGNLLLQTNSGFAYSGNVGIGMDNPSYKLSINGDIGLFNGNSLFGSLSDNAANLLINAKLGNLLTNSSAENLILQTASGFGLSSGNVGIGTSYPSEKLEVIGSARFSQGIVLNSGSIAASNSGLFIKDIHAIGNITAGGNINASGKITASAHLDLTGKLTRPLYTGTANLVPIAYGSVAGDGTVLWGTGNFTAYMHPDWEGEYGINLTTGEGNTDALMMVQTVGKLNCKATVSKNDFAGHGVVMNTDFVVGTTRSDNNFWEACSFYFVIYKM